MLQLQATMLEEERLGWIWRDPDQNLEGKVVAKRFRLQQKHKIGVVYDCSVSGLNAACGEKECFKIHSIDKMCAYIARPFSKCVALWSRRICSRIPTCELGALHWGWWTPLGLDGILRRFNHHDFISRQE